MSTDHKTLIYCGREMDPEPRGGFQRILNMLGSGQPVYVDLQPGDGTKYELLLVYAPLSGWSWELIVARLRNGDILGAGVVYFDSFNLGRVAPKLADGNKWTEELLRWWLEILVNRLKQEVDHETD